MNIAVILAGGTGNRVGARIPKQFIKVSNKPILVHTIEIFEHNANIDAIEIVCHKEWIDTVEKLLLIISYQKLSGLLLVEKLLKILL